MAQHSANILIDTRVFLDDPDILARIRQRSGTPFLIAAATGGLECAPQDAPVGQNAQALLRTLGKRPAQPMTALPDGRALRPGDSLQHIEFRGGALFLLGRAGDQAAAKLLQLARDYAMILISRGRPLARQAEAAGVPVALWDGPPRRAPLPAAPAPASPTPPVAPFALPSTPLTESDRPLSVRQLPASGAAIRTPSGRHLRLGAAISAGGEGSIFATDSAGEVCKVYHPHKLSELRRRKIELMVSRRIERSGLCWPTELALNEAGEFVGYLMPRASGRTVQSSMFVKPVLEKNFPHWRRRDLVNLCIAFVEHIDFLHRLNIIVGDINPLNLLVGEDSRQLWLVDTDSFQIENFPCPVGTVNFTAPEIQGRHYGDYLRSKEHELFAVATMLFMFLHPGKPPYSQQGGGSPMDNIKAMDFPYLFIQGEDNFPGKNAPQGPWQRIWSNLPYPLREAFHNTFRMNRRTPIDEWQRLLQRYRYSLEKEHTSDELFPMGFRIRDPMDALCGKCGARYIESEQWLRSMQRQGKQTWCPECVNRANLEQMADQSRRTQQAVGLRLPLLGQGFARPAPAPAPGPAPRAAPRPAGGKPPRGFLGFF